MLCHNGSLFGDPQRVPSDIAINDFISVTPITGSVAGNSSVNISVQFSTTNFKSNLYQQTLTISSNDADESIITVPISMTIVGNSQIVASVAALNFSDTFIGVTNSLPLTISNTGSDPLLIFDWMFSNTDFSIFFQVAESPNLK